MSSFISKAAIALCGALLAVGVAACGEKSVELPEEYLSTNQFPTITEPEATTQPEATTTAETETETETEAETETEPETATPSAAEDEEAIAALGESYARALSEEDWEAVCETRTVAEQAYLARSAGGSCPRAFERLFAGKPTAFLADVEAVGIEVRGNRASFQLAHPGQEPIQDGDRFRAVRDGGEWRLYDPKIRSSKNKKQQKS